MIDADDSQWDVWIKKCPNADVYHRAAYLNSMNTEPDSQAKLVIFECEEGVVVHPLVLRSLKKVGRGFAHLYDVISCYGYGGLAWGGAPETTQILLAKYWNEEARYLADHSVVTEFVRLHPLIPSAETLDGDPSLVNRWETFSIDLQQGQHELWRNLSSHHKRNIEKARKNNVKVDFYDEPSPSLLEEFSGLYHQTMRRVGARLEYFFSLERLSTLFGSLPRGEAWLGVATREGEIMAAFLHLAGSNFFHYHLGASSETGRRIGATHLLMFESFLFAREQGLKRMHIGGSPHLEGLYRFKSEFGGQKHYFQTLERVLVPSKYQEISQSLGVESEAPDAFFPAYRSPFVTIVPGQ